MPSALSGASVAGAVTGGDGFAGFVVGFGRVIARVAVRRAHRALFASCGRSQLEVVVGADEFFARLAEVARALDVATHVASGIARSVGKLLGIGQECGEAGRIFALVVLIEAHGEVDLLEIRGARRLRAALLNAFENGKRDGAQQQK